MDKEAYIWKVVDAVASKSVCPKAKVGAVFVTEDFEVLSTGYNGPARGMPHCDVVGHKHKDNHIHAEMNAIMTAAKNGTALKDSVLFVSHAPCRLCMMLIINLRVQILYIGQEYEPRVEGATSLSDHYKRLLEIPSHRLPSLMFKEK